MAWKQVVRPTKAQHQQQDDQHEKQAWGGLACSVE